MAIPPILSRLLIRSGLARLLPGLQRRLDGGADFLRYYSDRLLASPLSSLEQLGAATACDGPDVIDLATGSPCFDIAPAATPRVPADRRGWPELAGLPGLRGAISARLLADRHLAFSPAEEVLVTAGGIGAAQTIFDAFVNRGDRVALPEPTSPLYPLLARTRGASIRWVATRSENGRLRLRWDHLSRAMDGARLLVLCSPGNPAGGVIAEQDLEQVAWWADRFDCLILSDEVFAPLAEEHSSVGLLPRARQRTLTVGSVSKSHGLAHLRVGWIAAYRHLLRPCLATAALRTPFVPTLSQLMAQQALLGSTEKQVSLREKLAARREYVFGRLQAMGLEPASRPGGPLFHWCEVPAGWRGGHAFAEALYHTRRVRVLPGELFGPSGAGRVRLSFAADESRLEAGLDRVADLLRGGVPRSDRKAA